jgi:FAD/FMN-containing dehydrogenase
MWSSSEQLPATATQLSSHADRFVLPFGLGRSYGDSCLNSDNILVRTTRCKRYLAFDENSGVLRVECGATLSDILSDFLPRGWFLPVTPGTQYVTVGGAIANDVHGKNHHRVGTFGCHTVGFELLRSNGERLYCSSEVNSDFFAATIGGLGLTGLITWAEIRLRRVTSSLIAQERIKFRSISEFLKLSEESAENFEYTVSWIDCLARGRDLGRGVFIRANHLQTADAEFYKINRSGLDRKLSMQSYSSLASIPFNFPSFVLNTVSMRLFNSIYYAQQIRRVVSRRSESVEFFYPLDSIRHWNRIYGSRGFYQWQCVLPFGNETTAILAVLQKISSSGLGSFLAVLKVFGMQKSPGMLSFPRSGVTLSLDFPNRGEQTLDLLKTLDGIVLAEGGRLYPAKDARMTRETFLAGYPCWNEFSAFIDPLFSSSFLRRLNLCRRSNVRS